MYFLKERERVMKPKILIIDDQITIRTLLEFVLSDYDTILKEDGQEALTWLYNNDIPDLIIADLQMPNIDGYKFINILKSSGFYHNIPIVILSGNNSSNDRIQCFEAGVDDFIIKPFNPAELKIRVKNILNRVIANF